MQQPSISIRSMKKKATLAVIAATTLAANAVSVVVDNYIGTQNGSTTGAVGNFTVQSFTPSVAGLAYTGDLDTVAENSPLPTTVYLESATFLRALTGTATVGSLFIDVYLGDGNDGTYVGSSTNSIDVNNTAALGSMVWTFANFALTSASEYAFVFSTDNIAGNNVIARLQVARTAGGAFTNTYSGGDADDTATGNSPTAFDSRFTAQFNTVPEPSAALFGGLGMLALLRRRRS